MFREDELKGPDSRNILQQNFTGENKAAPYANIPVRVLTASSIIGDKVENRMGENLGSINNIMLNIQSGCIEYVVLEFGGFLGIGEKLFAMPFSSLKLDPERKTFLLDMDKEVMKNAPGFDKSHWPETNSRHWDDVGTYWTNYYGPVNPPPGPLI